MQEYSIYPAIHFLTNPQRLQRAIASINEELDERVAYFLSQQKYLEAERLQTRTKFDLEMLAELGYCSGIENYSRHLTGAKPGEPPKCLLDYFPEDFIMVIDESHVIYLRFAVCMLEIIPEEKIWLNTDFVYLRLLIIDLLF